ncbi:MAG: hypothetical protein R2711_12585 [Acidimicrobiales bacterium]
MPLPTPARLEEYARKGVELLLRTVGEAPEQRQARHLAAQHAGPAPEGGPKVLIVSPRDWAAHVQYEAVIGHALRLRGADVSFLTCGGGLEICDRANTYEAPPMPCTSCSRYTATSIEAHGFPGAPSARAGRGATTGGPSSTWCRSPTCAVEHDGLPLGRLVDIPSSGSSAPPTSPTIRSAGPRTGRSSARRSASRPASAPCSTRCSPTWCSS